MRALEVLTLVLLTVGAGAIPRPWDGQAVNGTTTIPDTASQYSTTRPKEHLELSETHYESLPLQTVKSGGPTGPLIGIESTVTGWETGPPTTGTFAYPPTTPGPSAQQPDVASQIIITTHTPVIVIIVTDISNPHPNPSPGPPGDQQQPSPGDDGHSVPAGPPAGDVGTTPPVPDIPQTTSGGGGGELLSDIISHIETAQPTSAPPVPGAPTDGSPTPAPTGAVDNIVTVGDTTLTLTPGLSTTVGSTVVAITTNPPGQTIIVVSSSGTAISATVTNSIVTLTTTQEPAVTDEPPERDNRLYGEEGASSSTSKAEGTVLQDWQTEWLIGVLTGIGLLLS